MCEPPLVEFAEIVVEQYIRSQQAKLTQHISHTIKSVIIKNDLMHLLCPCREGHYKKEGHYKMMDDVFLCLSRSSTYLKNGKA